MYRQSQTMSIPPQIAGLGADVDDDASASASVDNHHNVSYDARTLDDCVGVEDVATNPIYVTATAASGFDLVVVQRVNGASQLTLSFRVEVYVFDAITPNKGAVDFPRSDQPHRAASLGRFRQKIKERCFDKKDIVFATKLPLGVHFPSVKCLVNISIKF